MSNENLNNPDNASEDHGEQSIENTPLPEFEQESDEITGSAAIVDEIIEFYKDLPNTDTEQNNESTDERTGSIKKLFKTFNTQNEKQSYSSEDSEEIHDAVYGLNRRKKVFVRYGITAVICAAIISGSFGLAAILPGNETETEHYASELRKEKTYKSAKTEYDNIQSETKKLRDSVAEKKKKADNTDDLDNIQADVRLKINDKQKELNEINKSIAEKRIKLDELNEKIAVNSAAELTISPGRYVIGKDIVPGRYRITGTGTFIAASGAGKSKYNQRLGTESLDVTFEQGDNVKFDSAVKLTPLN